jgi:superfamily I DNA/RNA helicase
MHLVSKGFSVTCLTFTRQAAIEILHRCGSYATAERSENYATAASLPLLVTGTIHARVMKMAVTAGIRVLLPHQANLLLRTAWQSTGSAVPFELAQEALENLLYAPAERLEPELRQVMESYTELLANSKSVDFSSLLQEVADGIRSGRILRVPTDHLLIDEFQDLDAPQLDWVCANLQAGAIGTAVGDDDQSIYGFRRSLGFAAFQRFTDECSPTMFQLATNYRSHLEILSPAKCLVETNVNRIPKEITSHRGAGGSFKLMRYRTTDDEIQDLINTVATDASNWAIILRRNADSMNPRKWTPTRLVPKRHFTDRFPGPSTSHCSTTNSRINSCSWV